jgi:hypothetical protein
VEGRARCEYWQAIHDRYRVATRKKTSASSGEDDGSGAGPRSNSRGRIPEAPRPRETRLSSSFLSSGRRQ